MRTLDKYVLREWARVFAVVMLGFPVLAIVINITDKFDHYLAAGLNKGQVALAYIFYMPEMMFLVLPAAVLFATVFTIGNLGRHSELTAAKASGISFYRIISPILIVSVLAFVAGVGIGELAPVTSVRKAEILKERAVNSTTSRFNFVYRADSGWVYAAQSLDIGSRTMVEPLFQREGTGGANPTVIVAAQRAVYDPGQKKWVLDKGALRYLIGAGQEAAYAFDRMRANSVREKPSDLLAEPKLPEEMRYAELGHYIDALARSGSDTRKLAVEHALKISVPFTCIIIALFGAPLAVSNPRSGAAWGVAVSLATTFVFLLMVQLSKAVGAGGLLPPTLAAWFPNILAGVAAVWLMKKVRT
ncbi:MAG TPA: LptF/LptG family permease [Gemmatimonadales bacterium]|nr:LptF/LptG family permease [Gemmatimonadales bacterium]